MESALHAAFGRARAMFGAILLGAAAPERN